MRALVVEDDVRLNNVLVKRLRANGFIVETAFDGAEGLDILEADSFDIVISDIMMPKMDGIELLKNIRAKKIDVPVLILTARDAVNDKIKGLDLGADDYMVKPFEFDELLARIRVLTRRKEGLRDNNVTIGELVINHLNRTCFRGDNEIKLTFKEFELLLLLCRNKNRVMTRDQIVNSLYDWGSEAESNTVDVYIRYLRKKIDDNYDVKYIQTVRGIGYMVKL